jgi:hypothetical protein
VRVDRGGVEARSEQGPQALDQGRVVARPRQCDDDRGGAPVEVAAPEHARLLGLQPQQRDDRPAQVLDRRREQLVLREGLEERDRRLVVVRALDEVLGGEDPAQLAVQHRRLGGRLRVGARREQADDARLADDLAAGRDAADADVVHPRAAVHRRQAVGLRHQQQVAAERALAQPRIQRGDRDRLREGRAGLVAEQAESRAGHDAQRVTIELVVARAEEDEVLGRQPVQEGDDLGDLFVAVAHCGRPCHVDHLLDALAHRREVADDAAHVGEHGAHGVLEVGQLLGGQAAIELEVHDRLGALRAAGMHDARDATLGAALGAHDRMQEAHDAHAAGLQLGADGVDEERQVLGVGLEHRSGGLVAVLVARRVERAHRHRRAVARGGQLEGADDLGVEGLVIAGVVRRREPAQIRLGELGDGLGALGRQPLLHQLLDRTHDRPIMALRACPCHPRRGRSVRTATRRAA